MNVREKKSFLHVIPPMSREKYIKPVEVEEKFVKGDEEDAAYEKPSPFLPIGTPLNTSYLKLGEMLNVRPDILITPSVLQGTVKVRQLTLWFNYILENLLTCG